MDRVFLDANVLYSAAWRQTLAGLRSLWTLRGVTLLSSAYAIEEARRNLHDPQQRQTLNELIQPLEIVNVRTAAAASVPTTSNFPPKIAPSSAPPSPAAPRIF